MEPSLITLLFFAYTSILPPKSMVSFKFIDCFGLVFFFPSKFVLQISKKFSQLIRSFTQRHKYIYEICLAIEPEAGFCYL